MLILITLIGVCVGSFLSVVVTRLGRRGGILMGNSECPKCLRRIAWHDLVPLLSYLALKGRCRYCKTRISILYPLMEFASGAAFFLFFVNNSYQSYYSILFNLVVISSLISILFFDYIFFIIPDKIVFPLIGVSIIYIFLFQRSDILNSGFTALAIGGLFAILYIVSQGRWAGLGDAKLLFLIGLVLGYPLGIFALIISVWAAAILGIILVALGRANRKTPLPFGTFLSITTIIIIIYKNEIQTLTNGFF